MIYRKYIKRILDILCALAALIVFCWLYAIIAVLVRIKLGSPVVFKQIRPGMKDETGKERLFLANKFLTTTKWLLNDYFSEGQKTLKAA